MGKGRGTTNLGEGQYRVEVDTGTVQIQALVAGLNADIARWTTAKAAADIELAAADAIKPPLLSDLDDAINEYRAALLAGTGVSEAKNAVGAAVQAAFKHEITVQAARIPAHRYATKITEAQRRIAYLNAFDVETEQNMWCTDLTDDAVVPGNFATIEIPGEPKQTLVAPGCPVYVPATDGVLTARPAQSAEQLYLNLALLPGWQKWSPTYRVGVISDIQDALDVADVALDSARSSAQRLSINQESLLTGIPVEYMNCHAAAFQEGDRVVVQFEGQDWETPKVIGFETYPRMCPVGRARFNRHLFSDIEQTSGEEYSQLYINVKGTTYGGPGTSIIDYMRNDAEFGTYMLCIEYRMEGDISFTKMTQSGYHGPDPVNGPDGAVYTGPSSSPGGSLPWVPDGQIWVDDFYRYDERWNFDSGLHYDLAYGSGGNWDKTWKLSVGVSAIDFPGYESKYIEIRMYRKDDTKTPPLKKLMHFIYKYDPTTPLVWGLEDIDALIVMPTFGGPNGKPITKYPGSFAGFPQPQPTPDYW